MDRKVLRLGITATLACIATNVAAQGFDRNWIKAETSEKDRQVLFRRQYVEEEAPTTAWIHVSAAGKYELYVNEMNVTTDEMVPRDNASITYNVTRFLRADTNTVALWFAPDERLTGKGQIAVELYGRYQDGTTFSRTSDDTWLWREANANEDTIDGTCDLTGWNSTNYQPALWKPATTSERPPLYFSCNEWLFYKAWRVARIHKPMFVEKDGRSLTATFPAKFYGRIRLTLRGAEPGEKVWINGVNYICNGQTDEQACPKFACRETQQAVITGGGSFDPAQVEGIEGIEISPYNHRGWNY